MKFTELKENEPLEVVEITNHIVFSAFPNLLTGKRNIESDKFLKKNEFKCRYLLMEK